MEDFCRKVRKGETMKKLKVGEMKKPARIDAEDVREECEQAFWFITGLTIAIALCLLIAGILIWLLFKAFNLFAILAMEA